MIEVDTALIHGSVATGFEEIEVQFRKNFTDRGELGAACTVYWKGKQVVDLWGGLRDAKTGEPWHEDTLVLVFSTTKGMAAMAMVVAHSQGLFNLDEQVSTYWPEFAVGYAYAPNKCGYYFWDDPREKVLRDALYRCLKKMK